MIQKWIYRCGSSFLLSDELERWFKMMKRSNPLWGSISVLIGVVIAILALVRGAWLVPLLLLVFSAWGLWLVMFQLEPAWDSIRRYRMKERDARKQKECIRYPDMQVNADAIQLLLRHVNHRISTYLKSVYPNARWEWSTGDPSQLVMYGGVGRIRVYGIEDYDFADVQIDRRGNLSCNLLKVVPVLPNTDTPFPPNKQTVDPQIWYETEGRETLERLIADLNSRGHSELTLKEDGTVCIHEEDEMQDVPQEHLAGFPPKVYWPRLEQVLEDVGLSASIHDNGIAVSW